MLAAELAAASVSDAFTVDAVVTAGSPSAHVPRIPDRVRVLSLEDRDDPVALLGSLVNAGAANRTDVVFDASGAAPGEAYLAGRPRRGRGGGPPSRPAPPSSTGCAPGATSASTSARVAPRVQSRLCQPTSRAATTFCGPSSMKLRVRLARRRTEADDVRRARRRSEVPCHRLRVAHTHSPTQEH